MSERHMPTQPPPSPETQAQSIRDAASRARLRATRELRRARELEEVAAEVERRQR